MGSGGGLVTDDRLRADDFSSIRPLLFERLLFANEFSRLISLFILRPDEIFIGERLEKLSRFPKPMLGVYEDVRLVADLLIDDDLIDFVWGSIMFDESLMFRCCANLEVWCKELSDVVLDIRDLV